MKTKTRLIRWLDIDEFGHFDTFLDLIVPSATTPRPWIMLNHNHINKNISMNTNDINITNKFFFKKHLQWNKRFKDTNQL